MEFTYIKKDPRKIDHFRPIYLLNVEGKIFFGVIVKRMTRFVINNRYVNISIKRLEFPAFQVVLNIPL